MAAIIGDKDIACEYRREYGNRNIHSPMVFSSPAIVTKMEERNRIEFLLNFLLGLFCRFGEEWLSFYRESPVADLDL